MLIYTGSGICLQFVVVVVTGIEVLLLWATETSNSFLFLSFLFDLGLPFELPLKEVYLLQLLQLKPTIIIAGLLAWW